MAFLIVVIFIVGVYSNHRVPLGSVSCCSGPPVFVTVMHVQYITFTPVPLMTTIAIYYVIVIATMRSDIW